MRFALVSLFLITITAGLAMAQSLDQAADEFKQGNYEDAAFNLFDVLKNDPVETNRLVAEYFLAKSLVGMGLDTTAQFYFGNITRRGAQHTYFLKAIEGLLEIRDRSRDHLFVPALIDKAFVDANAFANLKRDSIDEIHYFIGERSYFGRKYNEASDFLKAVGEMSPYYPKARYLLGLIDARKGKDADAIVRFEESVEALGGADKEVDLDKLKGAALEHEELRQMGLLALGRSYFAMENFEKATDYYRKVPRFGWAFYDSLFEDAWARFRDGLDQWDIDLLLAQRNFGKSLGEISSVQSPFFAKRLNPEIWVLQATVYFHVCQWDRVRRTLDVIEKDFKPMLEELTQVLDSEQNPFELYKSVVLKENSAIPAMVARSVRRNGRFRDYFHMINKVVTENRKLRSIQKWKGSRLEAELIGIMDGSSDQLQQAVGGFAKFKLKQHQQNLSSFVGQARIIKFETAKAEKEWLEVGKSIAKKTRQRLPRPDIPDERHQHWDFRDEYWVDEIGYVQHTIRSECFDVQG